MSEFFGSVWWLLVTLGLLVTFHEYGHFVVARRCGVKVLKFSIGFGPALWSRFDRHGTEFVVAAIPLGGYVKMLDERENPDSPIAEADLAHAHNRASLGARMAISAAGPAFNLIFTLFAFWLMFVIGKPDYQPIVGHVDQIAATAGFRAGDRITAINGHAIETWTDASMAMLQGAMDRSDLDVSVLDEHGGERERRLALSQLPRDIGEQAAYAKIGLEPRQWALAPVVGSVQADSAAARAGLEPGDRIVSINGEAIGDWRDVSGAIQKFAAPETPLAIKLERAGAPVTVSATPVREADTSASTTNQAPAPRWLLGISPKAGEAHYDATLHYGPLAAIPRAIGETWERTRQTLDMLWSMVTGRASLKNLSGVITIAQVANSSAQLGPAWFLNFLAIISLSLAILNLLPIPVLDGGHLLYYLIELVKGSPVSERAQMAGQYVGLTLLMAMMSLAIYNDILRIAS